MLTNGRTVGSGPFRVIRYRIEIFNSNHFETELFHYFHGGRRSTASHGG
jgi:hypothetical protein